jgi:hypothetical protein
VSRWLQIHSVVERARLDTDFIAGLVTNAATAAGAETARFDPTTIASNQKRLEFSRHQFKSCCRHNEAHAEGTPRLALAFTTVTCGYFNWR